MGPGGSHQLQSCPIAIDNPPTGLDLEHPPAPPRAGVRPTLPRLPPAADGDERTVAMPSPAAAASATLERVASDIEAYLSKVSSCVYEPVSEIWLYVPDGSMYGSITTMRRSKWPSAWRCAERSSRRSWATPKGPSPWVRACERGAFVYDPVGNRWNPLLIDPSADPHTITAFPDGLPSEQHPVARLLELRGPEGLEGTGVSKLERWSATAVLHVHLTAGTDAQHAHILRVDLTVGTDTRHAAQIPPALWLDPDTAELWAAGKAFERGQVSPIYSMYMIYLGVCVSKRKSDDGAGRSCIYCELPQPPTPKK